MARKVSRSTGPKRSPLAWAGIGCGSVVALGLIGALVVYVLATAAPAPPPEARDSTTATTSTSVGQPSAPTAPTSPSATGSPSSGSATSTAAPLDTQMQYVENAMRAGRPIQVEMVVTESELNALLARESGSGDVRNPRVYFGNGTVVTTGQVTWRDRELWVTVRAHPVVSGGCVELAVDEVSVGRMPAPAAVREQVGRRLNKGMSRLTGRGRLHVQSVQITAGRMTLTGQAGGGR